jgi:hypothetical protein
MFKDVVEFIAQKLIRTVAGGNDQEAQCLSEWSRIGAQAPIQK